MGKTERVKSMATGMDDGDPAHGRENDGDALLSFYLYSFLLFSFLFCTLLTFNVSGHVSRTVKRERILLNFCYP